MNEEVRAWARSQPWYRCSDSHNIWSVDVNGKVYRWQSVKALREWDANNGWLNA